MPEYADIYVLSRIRTHERIHRFLEAFLPQREEAAAEYEVPQYSHVPHSLFHRAVELIEYCCAQPSEEHAIYWRAVGDGTPAHAMVFFLADGHVIFGCSVDASNADSVQDIKSQMERFFEVRESLLLHEQPPPESAETFKSELRKLETAKQLRTLH